MIFLDETSIRASFINASRKELSELVLPELSDLDRERLDYLGWRDRKLPRRAYAVIPVDGKPVGIVLKQAQAATRSRAQCSWCQDVRLPNDVVFYSTRRAGQAGRNGDSLGTLVCANFECSSNVRKLPPVAYIGFDVEAARQKRIVGLRERSAAFASAVLEGS
ncbi:FBP domain-containing protein [Parafrigoribacterium soli]|uniref:FBP domain-containing protein n=1 Tax=Parafrigoribacterium soli TaxID=3144663 RepID=UPI0032EEDD94